MNRRLLIDTDIVIDLLRGKNEAIVFFGSETDRIGFSTITVAEIYAGIRTDAEERKVERLFTVFPLFTPTLEIARLAGKFMLRYHRSHGIEMPDAIIAATCAVNNSELRTLNSKHYPMFKDAEPAYRKN